MILKGFKKVGQFVVTLSAMELGWKVGTSLYGKTAGRLLTPKKK